MAAEWSKSQLSPEESLTSALHQRFAIWLARMPQPLLRPRRTSMCCCLRHDLLDLLGGSSTQAHELSRDVGDNALRSRHRRRFSTAQKGCCSAWLQPLKLAAVFQACGGAERGQWQASSTQMRPPH